MTKWLSIALLLLAFPMAAQVTVVPATIPHFTFVDQNGAACAGCSLYTYAAGTSTPQATYTESTGTTQNTNPIVLDPDGGAYIWLASNSYKFVLKDTGGTTIWTTDNVNASRLLPCGTAGAIQIANSGANGLTCDATITIDTIAHTLNVGTLPVAHVTIGALGTPTSWTFDTTTPATALASLGGTTGTVNAGLTDQLAYYPSNGTTLSGRSSLPNGTIATTQLADDNSTKVATTAYVKAPGAVTPTSVALNGGTAMTDNQGTGAKVQHSTGSVTTDNCAKFDTNGNVVDAGAACSTVTTTKTCNANGCYRVEGDGTIEQWGQTSLASSGTVANLSATFPTSFTTTTNLQITLAPVGVPTGDGNPHPLACHISSYNASSLSVIISLPVQVGGSGYSALNSTNYCSYHAIGY